MSNLIVGVMPVVFSMLLVLVLRKAMKLRYALLPVVVNLLFTCMVPFVTHKTVSGHILLGGVALSIILMCWFLLASYVLLAINYLPKVAISPKTIVLSSAAFSLFALIVGFIQGFFPKISEHEIVSEKIPREADGYRVMLISDLHLRPTFPNSVMRRITDVVQRYQPNLILSAGDFIDGPFSGEPIPRLTDAIRQWEPSDGKYGCDGNHDFYAGFPLADRWLEAAQVEAVGQRCMKTVISPQPWLRVVAQDEKTELLPYPPPLSGENPAPYTILLRHYPPKKKDLANSLKPYKYDLILAGHTHGGQIFPVSVIVNAVNGFKAARFYQLEEQTRLYICRGTYLWGVAVRFLVPGEIVIFTFRSK